VTVARASIDTLLGRETGHIVDLRKTDPLSTTMTGDKSGYTRTRVNPWMAPMLPIEKTVMR